MNYYNVEIECTSLFIKIFNLNWEVVKIRYHFTSLWSTNTKHENSTDGANAQTNSITYGCADDCPQTHTLWGKISSSEGGQMHTHPLSSQKCHIWHRRGCLFFHFPQWLKLHSNLLPMWTNHWSIILLQKRVKKVRVPYNSWGVYGQIDDQPCLIKARGLLFRVESMQCADS